MLDIMSKISKLTTNLSKNKLFHLISLIFMMEMLILPMPGSALILEKDSDNAKNITGKKANIEVNKIVDPVFLSKNESKREVIALAEKEENKIEVAYTKRYAMTAYNSEVAQCDASPCITANGFNVCEHGIEDTVAANFLPFGTQIRIPELFGDRIFVVRDRMNKRYTNRIDVWLLHKDNAVDFGVKYPLVEVLK